MRLAVQYSAPTAALLREGRIRIDRFKCPAWPDLVAAARAQHPVYVHFPLVVGTGIGDAWDAEKHGPADWRGIEALLEASDTPHVNVHLAPSPECLGNVPADGCEPGHLEWVADRLTRDLRAVVSRFGAGRVVAENDWGNPGQYQRPIMMPGVIRAAVEGAGCGLLLDLAHARLAAEYLGMDVGEYIAALPIGRVREMHIAGVQRIVGRWLECLSRPGIDPSHAQDWAGQWTDHLPMTGEDWRICAWAMGQVHDGTWPEPWIVSFEYGGVGPLWEAVTDADVLARDIPRLQALVKAPPGPRVTL